MTIKKTSIPSSINTQYYSGTQASIFIGDVWVDDVTSIQYSIQHNRQPIYGYGSQHYDFVPKGRILVQGSFSINFREPNYLWLILKRYNSFNQNRKEKEKAKREEKRLDDAKTFPEDKRLNYNLFFNSTNPEQAKETLIETARLRNKSAYGVLPERFNHGVFAITLGYGTGLEENSIGERINSVQIMGKSKIINQDGRAIQETYQFIARDIS